MSNIKLSPGHITFLSEAIQKELFIPVEKAKLQKGLRVEALKVIEALNKAVNKFVPKTVQKWLIEHKQMGGRNYIKIYREGQVYWNLDFYLPEGMQAVVPFALILPVPQSTYELCGEFIKYKDKISGTDNFKDDYLENLKSSKKVSDLFQATQKYLIKNFPDLRSKK